MSSLNHTLAHASPRGDLKFLMPSLEIKSLIAPRRRLTPAARGAGRASRISLAAFHVDNGPLQANNRGRSVVALGGHA